MIESKYNSIISNIRELDWRSYQFCRNNNSCHYFVMLNITLVLPTAMGYIKQITSNSKFDTYQKNKLYDK